MSNSANFEDKRSRDTSAPKKSSNHSKLDMKISMKEKEGISEEGEKSDNLDMGSERKEASSQGEETKKTVRREEFLSLKKQNDEFLTEKREYEELIKRQQAEFDNYRKRNLKEKEEIRQYVKAEILKELLAVMDNFDRAIDVDVAEENEGYKEGFRMISDQLRDFLSQYDVREMKGIGSSFDPTFHEAIQFEEKPEVSSETVVEVYQKGYLMRDRVLRNAKVKICKPESPPAQPPKKREEILHAPKGEETVANSETIKKKRQD